MSRDSSTGTYTRVANSFSGPTAAATISPTDAESLFDELESEITDCVSRSGKGDLLADLRMGSFSVLFSERTAPSSPAANKIALYAEDNGSGTTHLKAKDSSGTVTNFMAGGTVGGSTGATDNAALRADGTGGSTVQTSPTLISDDGSFIFPEMSAPSTPASGKVVIYPKSDGRFYEKDDAGTERGLSPVGKHTLGVASGALFPASTNGCAAIAQAESSSNKINYKYLAFDATSIEYAWFWIPTPKSYNASTVTMRAAWTHPSTSTNFAVVWQFEILSLSNDDAIDTAVGTAVTVTDTGGTTQDFYLSDASGAITPSNTAAKQDWLAVRVSRKASDGSDTMAVDAHLIGVEVFYNIDAPTDD